MDAMLWDLQIVGKREEDAEDRESWRMMIHRGDTKRKKKASKLNEEERGRLCRALSDRSVQDIDPERLPFVYLHLNSMVIS